MVGRVQENVTPLHRAALNGHAPVVTLLLERGANKEATAYVRRTEVHHCCLLSEALGGGVRAAAMTAAAAAHSRVQGRCCVGAPCDCNAAAADAPRGALCAHVPRQQCRSRGRPRGSLSVWPRGALGSEPLISARAGCALAAAIVRRCPLRQLLQRTRTPRRAAPRRAAPHML
jgi:ankyrin repeat protein